MGRGPTALLQNLRMHISGIVIAVNTELAERTGDNIGRIRVGRPRAAALELLTDLFYTNNMSSRW